MNEITQTANRAQSVIQTYATRGLLTCQERQRILNQKVITFIALNILFVAATISTAVVWSAPVIFPIGFGIASLIYLALTVYKIYDRIQKGKEAARWEPIFKDIIQAKYADAHAKMDALLKDLSPHHIWPLERHFYIKEPTQKQQIDCCYLHANTLFLQSLSEISSGNKKTPQELSDIRERITKWGNYMYYGRSNTNEKEKILKEWLDAIEGANASTSSEKVFSPSPISSTAALSLLMFMAECRKYDGYQSTSTPLRYLRLIQTFEENSMDSTEKDILKGFLKCKDMNELKKQISSISQENIKTLFQKSGIIIN